MTRWIALFAAVALFATTARPAAPEIVSAPKPLHIRLLCLKHSKESMADGDANLAIKAVDAAAGKGLHIKNIGNHFIDKNGKVLGYCMWEYGDDLPKLKAFISEQVKVDAQPGDTLVIFTIGHGFTSGGLHNLGKRAEVMKAIAEAAEENNQKVLWWQLSCHASVDLPNISTLTPKQQKLFTMFASSDRETSAAGVQGKLMEKLFIALAEMNSSIDPNQDGKITAEEFKAFLTIIGQREKLFSAMTGDYVVFGRKGFQFDIPIVDKNNRQRQYDREYILLPGDT